MIRKDKFVISLIVLFIFVFTANISFADESVEPELHQLPRFDDELITIESPDVSPKKRAASLESYYDMRQQSYSDVIHVKNQGNTGLCWAFAATTAAEISRAKQLADSGETVDFYQFSPYHLGYFLYNRVNDPLGKTGSDKNILSVDYRSASGGGNSYMTFQGLANWTGLAYEEKIQPGEYSYDSKLAYDNDYIIKYAEFITDSKQKASNAAVKDAVKEYGSVVVDMYYSKKYLNSETSAYITSMDARYGNHIVTIVGWDDNFSKENFRKVPDNDGAWIVQNSYGLGWGEDGYMYISYEDSSLACPMAINVVPENTYDYNYQYDGNANPEAVLLKEGKKLANVFSVPKNSERQSLESVGFTTLNETYAEYIVEIYTDVSGTNNPVKGTRQCSFAVSTDNEGYFTFDVPSPVKLTPGSKYSIVITAKDDVYFGVEKEYDYGWVEFEAGHAKGRSFCYDGSWEDLYYSDICARIKGLTVETNPVDISRATVKIKYNNYRYVGRSIRPAVTVIYNGSYLKKGRDFKVSYGENIWPGKGHIYIQGTGDFGGELVKVFEIAKVTGLKVKSYGTDSITLKWTSEQRIDGYKIYMYMSDGYECVKTVKGASASSATIKNLVAGKGYSFKICTYVGEHESSLSDKLSARIKGLTVEDTPIDIDEDSYPIDNTNYSDSELSKSESTVNYNGNHIDENVDYGEKSHTNKGYTYITGNSDAEEKLCKDLNVGRLLFFVFIIIVGAVLLRYFICRRLSGDKK